MSFSCNSGGTSPARLAAYLTAAGACGFGQTVQAGPVPLDSLPLTAPPNPAIGVSLQVGSNPSVNYEFRYSSEYAGVFTIAGAFLLPEIYSYLTCFNEAGGPGEPNAVVPQFGPGAVIDNSLAGGSCSFSSSSVDGNLDVGTFTSEARFAAVRARVSDQDFFGFLQIRIGEDGVLRVLNGAFESRPNTPITTTTDPQTIFGDRFQTQDLPVPPDFDEAVLSALAAGHAARLAQDQNSEERQ